MRIMNNNGRHLLIPSDRENSTLSFRIDNKSTALAATTITKGVTIVIVNIALIYTL